MKLPSGVELRLRLIRSYFSDRFRGQFSASRISFGQFLRRLFSRGVRRRAGAYLEKVTEMDGYYAVEIRGCALPLFIPTAVGLHGVYCNVDDVFCTDNWHYYGELSQQELAGKLVIDCGAAEGVFAAKCVGAGFRVVAFEPLPMFVAALRKTFAGRENFELVECAVGARDDTVSFCEDGVRSGTSHSGGLQVKRTTLDSVILPREEPVGFIKADIEGSEYDMLIGAYELVRRDRPRLALTVYHAENNVYQIERLLKEICPAYQFRRVGMAVYANPVLLHCWCE
jgi:FkbM family methyltransferase